MLSQSSKNFFAESFSWPLLTTYLEKGYNGSINTLHITRLVEMTGNWFKYFIFAELGAIHTCYTVKAMLALKSGIYFNM